MSDAGRVVTFVLMVSIAAPASASDRTGSPPPFVGVWQVEQLVHDAQDWMHQQYHPGDPRLIGRTVVIDVDRVNLHFGTSVDCHQPSWPQRKTTWGFLASHGFPRPEGGPLDERPVASDFEVGLGAKQAVVAYPVCSEPRKGHGRQPAFPLGQWIVPLPKDRIALRADPQFVLILVRRPADAKPMAGTFDCKKASNPTEATICGDFDLASWDRSVSAALDALLKEHPAATTKIQASQHDYIRKRNACKTDKACIDYIQESWVDLLVDERNSSDALIEEKDPVEDWQPDAGAH